MKNLKQFCRRLFEQYIEVRSLDEDQARKQYIFNILAIGSILLVVIALIGACMRYLAGSSTADNVSPLELLAPIFLLVGIYYRSRRHFGNFVIYLFIGLYFLLGTFALYVYSFTIPQGLLVYALVITISGILISSRAALWFAMFAIGTLGLLAAIQIKGVTRPFTEGLADPFYPINAVLLYVLFAIIAVVSWLSNREIEASLLRARSSEAQLLAQRDSLEDMVIARTKALEEVQLEKSKEMYRFAEFGRLSSGLVHDLANPLTAVSLNFEQLQKSSDDESVTYVRQGIAHMEQYMESARRQLRNQGEDKLFDSKEEIEKVIEFLNSKARQSKVTLRKKLLTNRVLFGDSVKFSQIISNLLANAIDAYSGTSISKKRTVWITSAVNAKSKTVMFSVKDNGVGISKTELAHIFEAFYSTKSSDRGTGIGLTITNRIVTEDFRGKLKATQAAVLARCLR